MNAVHGLQNLRTANIARNDEHIEYLNTVISVNVHTNCRKDYISNSFFAPSGRRLEEEEPASSLIYLEEKEMKFLTAKHYALFCG